MARVTVVLTDSFGRPLAPFKVVSFEDQHKRDLVGQFNDGSASGVPLGSYWVKLEFGTGGRLSRAVVVDRMDCLVVLSDNPFHAEYPKGQVPVLSGVAKNLPVAFAGFSWVKLCGLFIGGCAVAQIDSGGHFSFINVTPAAYTLEMLGESGQSFVERVDIEDPGVSIVFDGSLPAGDRVKLGEKAAPSGIIR